MADDCARSSELVKLKLGVKCLVKMEAVPKVTDAVNLAVAFQIPVFEKVPV
jgi:hypothetical protein